MKYRHFQQNAFRNRLANDETLMRDFVMILLQDGPVLIDSMREAVRQSNPTKLNQSAHSVKGLVSNFGAKQPTHSASSIEKGAENGIPDDVGERINQLEHLLEQLYAELRHFLESTD